MRSPIKWFGGKSRLARDIVSRFPPHVCYVEVFGGAAWVLFAKERNSSKSEIYNDINGDLINLFTVLRDQFDEFYERARWLLPDRVTFERARDEPREGMDAIERALRFYTLVQYSFNINLYQWKPKTLTRPPGVDYERLSLAAKRLQKVWIERLDFEQLIKKFDGPETFFYVDPPYGPKHAQTSVYGWKDEEHERLKRVLSSCRGKYLISYPDTTYFRILWRDHFIDCVPYHYSSYVPSLTDGARDTTELLISNYDTTTVRAATPGKRARRNAPSEQVVNADAYA